MAQHDTIQLSRTAWTQLTNADVTELRVQNITGAAVYIQATATATPPSADDGSLVLEGYSAIAPDLTLDQLFPGVTSPARVWGKGSSSVSVSHA